MSGRVGCAMCDGQGYIPTELASAASFVDDDGEFIMPCPLCVSKDKMMYGNAFIQDGKRVEPRCSRCGTARTNWHSLTDICEHQMSA